MCFILKIAELVNIVKVFKIVEFIILEMGIKFFLYYKN